jgi:hypothetical protein
MSEKQKTKAEQIKESLQQAFAQRGIRLTEVTLNDLVPKAQREKPK